MDMKTFGILEKYCEKEGLKMAVPIQTNEEWLRSASTLEELAARVFKCAMANSWAMNEQQFKTAILSWLKEKHKE